MAVDDTPKPEHVDDPKTDIDTSELDDLNKSDADDQITKELTETQRADQEDDKIEDTKSDNKEAGKPIGEVVQATQQTDGTTTTTQQTESDKTKELENQLKFYEQLFGPKEEAAATFQAPTTPQPPVDQTATKQPQVNILDAVQITENDLTDLLSGAPERATPVIKKFIGTAMYLATQNFLQTQQMHERVAKYNDSCVNAFYEQYDDLKNFRPIVKFAGDQIQQEYQQRGIQKYPHQLIKEIGDRARTIRDQMLGSSTSPTKAPPKTIKQGEVSGTKPAPAPKQKLTEQQTEMMDLLED